ncbi:FAD-binding oxidoreductase [Novosphingobium sp. P6W]|uniref:FAD-binding oxidoreductase n=1 Tax=Novosphingobium sp. P6W TaxID=1609758 RepID=UPI0005C2A43A|nr:FAD-binding oxidoreductase [Novosphingobium sp. P6W]AXB80131.1 FAD-binding oxidoreductase [Novosphingobium sp. P6W]KIS29361.1 FAD-linked oxidase [Novosphingobium sp. P6W]
MTETPITLSAATVVDQLVAALGPDIVTLAAEAQADGRRFADWSGVPSGDVLALVRPRSTEDLSRALAICHSAGQPVTVQGGLTGLAGGASALDGEIAVSLERMKAIEEVDPISATMTVQAGCILQTVQEAALQAGYFFPLDLGARGSCTIGGVLATNAGGNRVIKYGMTRDLVLGVEAVLADGSVISGLHKMLKNNSGYDLKNLLIGSEGTLGVITRVVLRLRPRPLGVSTAWCGLSNFESVTSLLRRAQSELAGGVSAFEVMWPSYLGFVLGNFPELRRPLAGEHAFHVLLETDGADPEAQGEQFEGFLGRMFEDEILDDAAVAMSDQAALDFWAVRDAPGEFPRLIPKMIAFDISFAVRDLADAAERITQGLDERYPGSLALVYGHLGDGNLHLIIDVPGATKEVVEAVEAFVYGVVSELNGSVSAEHGIGLKKRNVLSRTRTPAELAAMVAIKRGLDPKSILGRGRILG